MHCNVFAYGQWRNSERLGIQVALSYTLKAVISDHQARHWLYAVLGSVVFIIF
jgi:hypothetical protein